MDIYYNSFDIRRNKFGGVFFNGKKLPAQKIVEIINVHLEHPNWNKQQIAQYVKCSINTVTKYLDYHYYEEHEESTFDIALSNVINDIILHYPQIFLKEIQIIIQNHYNISVSKSKLYSIIISRCYFKKKRLSIQSDMRNTPRIIQLREQWLVCQFSIINNSILIIIISRLLILSAQTN